MQYILIIFCSLFFLGCSPKYKSVNEHILPSSAQGQECISKCQKQYGSCKEICKANLEICKTKAIKVAKENYERKNREYVSRLERYVDEMRMHELNMNLYYFNGPFGYGYRWSYYPRSLFWYDSYPVIRPYRPIKPSLSLEVEKATKEICDTDCGCTQTYDKCFVGCGGIIGTKEVCIENCP